MVDRQSVALTGLENNRGLDPRYAGPAREFIERQILEVKSVTDSDVHNQVVSPRDQIRRPHLRNAGHVPKKVVNRLTFVLRETDHQQRLEANAEYLWIGFRVQALENAILPQSTNALVRGRRRQAHLGSDRFDGGARVILQNAEDGEIYPVKFDDMRLLT